jgi:hypothetical protein
MSLDSLRLVSLRAGALSLDVLMANRLLPYFTAEIARARIMSGLCRGAACRALVIGQGKPCPYGVFSGESFETVLKEWRLLLRQA